MSRSDLAIALDLRGRIIDAVLTNPENETITFRLPDGQAVALERMAALELAERLQLVADGRDPSEATPA